MSPQCEATAGKTGTFDPTAPRCQGSGLYVVERDRMVMRVCFQHGMRAARNGWSIRYAPALEREMLP